MSGPIVRNIDKVVKIVESKHHVNSVSVAQGLNIWMRLYSEKSSTYGPRKVHFISSPGSNFDVRITVQMQQSRPISAANGDWANWIKTHHNIK